jgi:hypothetical protein
MRHWRNAAAEHSDEKAAALMQRPNTFLLDYDT